MIVIKLGKEWNPGNLKWQSYVNGYFESEKHAEKYLVDNGYERDHDDIFFKDEEIDSTDIAVIERFQRIEVKF